MTLLVNLLVPRFEIIYNADLLLIHVEDKKIKEELAEALTEEMKQEGTSNDMEHSEFVRGDEVDLLGEGVPGYQTTGETHPTDQIEHEQEDEIEEEGGALSPFPPRSKP